MTNTMTMRRTAPHRSDAEQAELDLGAAMASSPAASRQQASKTTKRGLPRAAFALTALGVASVLWGAWVTKTLVAPPAAVPMASVRLEQLIGEYVQAQARGNTPPELVTQQTQAFMTALGTELNRRGEDGTTVLVGEAVLSKNVPDITAEVRAAIYAKVPMPAPAAAAPPMVPMPMAPMAPAPAAPPPAAAPLTGMFGQ